MEKIGVVIDSGCDLPKDIAEKHNVRILPLRTFINGEEYEDGTFSEEFLFEHLDEDVKTSLPKPEKIKETMENMINEGYKKILTFNISHGLSGSYNIFTMVSRELREKYPDVRIENIDTLNISIGSGIIVYRALEYIEHGFSYDEILEKVKKDINNATVFYVIPTLKYLARGGRIGKVSAAIGNFLDVKPIISVNEEGIYYTVAKVRNIRRAVNAMYEEFLKFVGERDFYAVVSITGKSEKAVSLQNMLFSKMRALENSLKVFMWDVSATLAVHTGPDLVGIGILRI
ncbi:6-phosphogluconate dehydratase [Marinitoga sp. 1135]|uniref:EDD domain protein, DegV family n=1 Tax=Marinitoga piezophila (strain DSM 14283 / JCM 11233 / KA3) TaxID=443254 RepID=H2J7V3_MARPK|nr:MULTISPECIES: DegV family protein [Marinitoga]AEX85444.1 EDD domain protein, DegV family [Marinitoga piezophila KA3]APT75919.1 6-phosphogluconate dehydratase [Marinitoga sp. 1137]NUU95664.1 6-phosphogluconate dehydratase [Marinitoga sp. 1135]NUU97585.1 6-phosphogluconate dehydratase [Marinitoga sp. 1138]